MESGSHKFAGDDVPDEVCPSLLTHEDSVILESPSIKTTTIGSEDKLAPEQAQTENKSRKNSDGLVHCDFLPPISSPSAAKPMRIDTSSDDYEHQSTVSPLPILLGSKAATPSQGPASTNRSKTMLVGGSPSSNASPLDKKVTPSEKFRSFMMNFTAVKDGSKEGFGDNDDEMALGAMSVKAGTPFRDGQSPKLPLTAEEEAAQQAALQARIARVQEEQAKFRMSQRLRMSLYSATSSKNGSFKEPNKDKQKKLKPGKDGFAPCFNGNALLGGLHRGEFRETLDAGAALLRSTHRLDDDLFNENSLPMRDHGHTHSGQGHGGQGQPQGQGQSHGQRVSGMALIPDHLQHLYRTPSEHSTLLAGEGYIGDEDWHLTDREAKAKEDQQSTPAGAKSSTLRSDYASQQNLEEFIQQALKEQAALRALTSDCPDAPDVPLAYLQSSSLIEKRFGWAVKDHSVAKPVPVRHKSWQVLRSVVAGAGAFNFLAAAAASPVPGDDTQRVGSPDTARTGRTPSPSHPRPALDPAPDAPVIVIEATPVTELVAKLKEKETLHRSSLASLSEDEVSLGASASVGSIGTTTRTKLPAFHISKAIPRKLSPERAPTLPKDAHPVEHPVAPLAKLTKPAKPVVAKEDTNTAMMKSHSKEFQNRYNGLLFRDSSRHLIWQDTEDMILGTQRHHKNAALTIRSDVRWAGKTMNMFRPWSAARQEDVIDQLMYRQASSGSLLSSNSRPGSRPGSRANSADHSPSTSPQRGGPLPRIESMGYGYGYGSGYGSYSPGGGSVGGDSRYERGGSRGRGTRHRASDADSVSLSGSLSGSVTGSLSGSVCGSVTFGGVTINSGKTHNSRHMHERRQHSPGSTHHPHPHQVSGGASVGADTMHSGFSRSTGVKRMPLLVNVVKNVHASP